MQWVLLAVEWIVAWGAIALVVDDHMRREPTKTLEARLRPFSGRSVADEVQDWLERQSKV